MIQQGIPVRAEVHWPRQSRIGKVCKAFNGGLADQWTDSGTSNQQWSFVASNGGYKLINVNSGLLLDNPGGSKSMGTQLDQWNDTNGSNQWWNIVSAGGGYYSW